MGPSCLTLYGRVVVRAGPSLGDWHSPLQLPEPGLRRTVQCLQEERATGPVARCRRARGGVIRSCLAARVHPCVLCTLSEFLLCIMEAIAIRNMQGYTHACIGCPTNGPLGFGL